MSVHCSNASVHHWLDYVLLTYCFLNWNEKFTQMQNGSFSLSLRWQLRLSAWITMNSVQFSTDWSTVKCRFWSRDGEGQYRCNFVPKRQASGVKEERKWLKKSWNNRILQLTNAIIFVSVHHHSWDLLPISVQKYLSLLLQYNKMLTKINKMNSLTSLI